MRIALLPLACAVLAAGCVAPSMPAGTKSARIEYFRANADCGPAGSPICEARVAHVEGKPMLTFNSYVDTAPGAHVLGLYCRYNLSIMIGDAQSVQRELEVDLEPGARYRLQASMAPAPCTMRLVKESP